MEDPRTLPAALDAERSILGSLLQNNKLAPEVFGVPPEIFSLDSHRRCFKAMAHLLNAEVPMDIVTLAEELQRRKELQSVGGVAWLASLTEGLPRRPSIAEYVRIVNEKATLRDLMREAEHVTNAASDQSEDSASIIARAQAEIERIASRATQTTLELVSTFFQRAFPKVDDWYARDARKQGVPTGFRDFDQKTFGLQAQELIILAARPSMGKTAWAGNVVTHVAVKRQRTVAFFSLEMSKAQLIDRFVCSHAGVSLAAHRTNRLGMGEAESVRRALADLIDAPLYIDDEPGQSVAMMFRKAAQLKAAHGLDLIVIDHLGLIDGERKHSDNREQAVAASSRAMKGIAKRLNVPVMVLAQLNRELLKRSDRRPMLSDLRESGSIEQDADMVIFLHRDDYYDAENAEVQGKAEIIVAKQRQGAVGTVHCSWQGSCVRFADSDPSLRQGMF